MGDLRLAIAAGRQLTRDVRRLALVPETSDSRAVIELGADSPGPGLDRIKLGVGQIAGVVGERAGRGVSRYDGRAGQLQGLEHPLGRKLRDVDQDAQVVEQAN